MSNCNIKLTFEEKLEEYLKEMENNNSKIIKQNNPQKFSDGSYMGSFWNSNKKKIYEKVTDEEHCKYYQEKFPKCCESIKDKYTTKILTVEDKLEEYLEAMQDNNFDIIKQNSTQVFSDKSQMRQFFNTNKEKIYELITTGEKSKHYQTKYSKCCEVIINKINNKELEFEKKLEEYLEEMKNNNNNDIVLYKKNFSDSSFMKYFWINKTKKIYEAITSGKKCMYYWENYKECCISIIKKYNIQKNSFEKRLNEFIVALNYTDNVFKINDGVHFSDGTLMWLFWNGYKFKICNIINSNNKDNEYYKNYKYSCDRINIEIYKHLIKFKKYEEAKEIFNDESEYTKLLNDYNIKIKK